MYALELVTAAVMIAMIYLFSHWQAKGREYIAVIHYVGTEAGDDIVRALGRIKYAVIFKIMLWENTEMAVEVFCKDPNMEFADRIRAVKCVQDVTLIQYIVEYLGQNFKDPGGSALSAGDGSCNDRIDHKDKNLCYG